MVKPRTKRRESAHLQMCFENESRNDGRSWVKFETDFWVSDSQWNFANRMKVRVVVDDYRRLNSRELSYDSGCEGQRKGERTHWFAYRHQHASTCIHWTPNVFICQPPWRGLFAGPRDPRAEYERGDGVKLQPMQLTDLTESNSAIYTHYDSRSCADQLFEDDMVQTQPATAGSPHPDVMNETGLHLGGVHCYCEYAVLHRRVGCS